MPAARAVVLGRAILDLHVDRPGVAIEEAAAFLPEIGGTGPNVATGLARLGVPVRLVSAVGDDAHGRRILAALRAEGVDVDGVRLDPEHRTTVAFCARFPPDRFPVTIVRSPSAPDWETGPGDVDPSHATNAPLLVAHGTWLARERSRLLLLAALEARAGGTGTTLLDLDLRPGLWPEPAAFRSLARIAARLADILIATPDEVALLAADGGVDELLALGPRAVIVTRGAAGATVHGASAEPVEVGVAPVADVSGLGAGDAFAAALAWRLLAGDDVVAAAQVACAAGAHLAGRLGCASAMPWPADLLG